MDTQPRGATKHRYANLITPLIPATMILWCFHCRGPHRVGDAKCPKAIEEKQILTLQDRYKVGRRRARQLYDGNTENNTRSAQFTTHFKCTVDEDLKRKLTPWHLDKQLQSLIGTKPTSI